MSAPSRMLSFCLLQARSFTKCQNNSSIYQSETPVLLFSRVQPLAILIVVHVHVKVYPKMKNYLLDTIDELYGAIFLCFRTSLQQHQ